MSKERSWVKDSRAKERKDNKNNKKNKRKMVREERKAAGLDGTAHVAERSSALKPGEVVTVSIDAAGRTIVTVTNEGNEKNS